MTTNAAKNAPLRELVLHVARRCEQHEMFGIVKLNKILFYADLKAFLARGRSISGAQYVKKPNGPVPDGMPALIARMVDERALVELEREMPDTTTQRRPIAVAKPDLSGFDPEDIAALDEVIEWTRHMSARKLSDLSHDLPGWKAARFDEVIPYGTAYVPASPLVLTEDEATRVKTAIAELSATT